MRTIIFSFIASFLLFAPSALAQGIFGNNLDVQKTSIPSFLNSFYGFALVIGGVLVMGGIVFGGVMYITEGAVPQKKTEGKTIILGALWGLALLLGAYVILRTVNPEIVTLDVTELDQAHFDTGCNSSSTVIFSGGKRIVKPIRKCDDFELPGRDDKGACTCYTNKQWVDSFESFSNRVENEADPHNDEVVSGTIGSKDEKCFLDTFGNSSGAVQKKLITIKCGPIGNIQVHELAKSAFETACAKIPADAKTKCGDKFVNSGTFNWRKIAGSNSLSNHSFGVAFDISAWACGYCDNVSRSTCYDYTNKRICRAPAAQGHCTTPNLPLTVVNAFKTTAGFRWGGDYKNKTDNMHFEWLGPCGTGGN